MKVDLLGINIDALDLEETVRRIAEYIRHGLPRRVVTINPEFLYRARADRELCKLAGRADLVTPDGVGIVWACRVAGSPVPERVTGIDLMMRLVEQAAVEGWSIFLLGAAPGVAEEAAARLSLDYPGLRVAGVHHGYFKDNEEAEVAGIVRESRPDLLFVALGAPKQEWWIDRNLQETGAVVAVGVGGSFDVVAGKVRRAPRWIRRLHLEWLFRLVKDPSRWRRQAVLPLFAWLVLREYRFKRRTR
ncbi:WecB/TagA/CpsF family glycosyltransferase [Pelotomaculum terephthalicicum JT]|uniref:WecB/TagA/CpsF family glycosyltransferase n=1 Tax=Pelotomaculum TaxID=191373 RepID=UPI0009D1B3F6|nr:MULTISPECIES: WecB/TagA/CpsF family glycosyltransferase [Pelotomaculum]MCG9966456.1 WecB/TagA/CpsF family glycosyltransferase [Pelotomaculum terephthalicicum JT]OPX89191.1 MAG: putative N-acetylmannosaminyltransferase [Pelotomaculum sp. PtaB.Bin117]OPY63403.1 MAG: putative N-acetylmannosaminyltransferase [Pelotomaculum sp. PtaU1.Bin065]